MLFGIYLRTPRTPKFWHTYVITYGDFIVIPIVEPCKCDQESDLWQQLVLASDQLVLNLIYEILWTGVGRGLSISMLQKFNWFCLTSLITLVLLIRKWMGLFLRKNHLLR